MKSYRLVFLKQAAREWSKLGATVRHQFERKLAERLTNPKVPGDRLAGHPNCYKIKLKSAGYRLIYQLEGEALVVFVVRIGQREGGQVYDGLAARLAKRR